MIRRPTIPLAAALLLAVGCSSGRLLPARGADPAEMAEIKARILELQRSAAMTQVEIDRLRQQLAAVEARLGAADAVRPAAAVPPPLAPVAPPAEPAGEIEISDLDEQPQSAPPPPAVPPPSSPELAGEAAQALYDRGYTLYHQGRYVDAEAGFRRFLQAYPDTSLSDNAQYWIGESRFARGDYEGALAAFEEAVQRYPGGNKLADSLLKAGDCMQRLGEAEAARAAWDEVRRRFPGSAAAAMADERLDQRQP